MNVDQRKDNIKKIKNLCMLQKIFMKDFYHIWKKTLHFIQGKQVWKIRNRINKEDTSMNYFPKIAYWMPLVPTDEIVDKTTNPYF